MITLAPGNINEIVVLGAHCDDIAIGAGGTLLNLAEANPGMQVRALVMTGGNSERRHEECAALRAFCPDAKVELAILDLPDGLLPEHCGTVKKELEQIREYSSPDIIFAPNRFDAHQDHRLLAELTPTVFRDHLSLGYEIVKWESDLGSPNVYQALTSEIAERKAALLTESYPSQHGKYWFERETFLSLARIRGVHCRARYAEAFYVDKLSINVLGQVTV